MALGARHLDVISMVMSESIVPVAAGLAAGSGGAFIATRWIDHLLFGISAHDPQTIVEAAIVFLLIAACAAIVPTWRAIEIDPLRALRVE